MTASVPSKIAFATSEASARVGVGLRTIDSSIWVAVITGLPASMQARISRFWISGTRSAAISTPRSPRATMTPSTSSRISGKRSTALGFSIFAISRAFEPARAR